jgi:hypothetical protein
MHKILSFPLISLTLVLGACARPTPPIIASPAPTLTSLPSLATPYAMMPAAGICGVAEGERVTISLEPGIPNPRCVQVQPEQMLTVVNLTGGSVDISLGEFQATLAPGKSINLDKPFGEYLARGVHALGVSPCCGGEIVLGIDLNS